MLGGVDVERQRDAEVLGDLRRGLGHWAPYWAANIFAAASAWALSSAPVISRIAAFAPARRTWAARPARSRSCGTSSTARGFRGTRRAAPSRTRARRRPPRAPARASAAGTVAQQVRPRLRRCADPSVRAMSSLRIPRDGGGGSRVIAREGESMVALDGGWHRTRKCATLLVVGMCLAAPILSRRHAGPDTVVLEGS